MNSWTPEVEVVTLRAEDGTYETLIHGGRLDGQKFPVQGNVKKFHATVCRLVRVSAWPRAVKKRRGEAA
jgi:hypothetical protein